MEEGSEQDEGHEGGRPGQHSLMHSSIHQTFPAPSMLEAEAGTEEHRP